jgi:hypothetical protein
MIMPVKQTRRVLFLALVVFLICGSCKDSVTVSDSYDKPVIWVNTFEMTFAASELGPNPSNQTLNVKNVGRGTLSYNITDDADIYEVDWLSVTPSSGASSGEIAGHVVSVDKTGLAKREEPYTAKITVTGNDAYNTPQVVNVSLALTEEPPPQIGVTPKTLSFSAQLGGSNPAVKTITVQNTGESTLNYQITTDKEWLKVAPPSGVSEGAQKNHNVSVDIAGLAAGTHQGTITITDINATNNPQTVSVNLQISKEAPPQIWVSTKTLSFSAEESAGNPAAKTFQVRNTGEGTLNYQITWDESWMNVSPDSGTSAGASKTHRVTINKTGMTEGTYRGTITVSDPNASNSPQSIAVTLRITKQAPPSTDNDITLSVSPTSGSSGQTVTITIGVKGNLQPISAFGMDLTYNGAMFDFVSSSKGTLTGNWGLVSANSPSQGLVKVGGAAFGGTPIPVGSTGSVIIIQLRVTGGSLSNGDTSKIQISTFTDDIAGMGVPSSRTFTLKK